MDAHISWLGIIVAIVIGMAIAFVSYSDWGLLGRTWRRLTGVTPQDSAAGGKAPMVILLAAIIATAIVLAVAIAIAGSYFDDDSVWLAVVVAGVAWVGFSASTLAQHNGFELKPARLTVINTGYQLVMFVGMAIPIGLL